MSNLFKVNDAYNWNQSEAQSMIPLKPALERRAEAKTAEIEFVEQKKRQDFIKKWATDLWP